MKSSKASGFTIVELLIVIVVIAILAAITIVAYNGIQARSRDSARTTATSNIKKALELYRVQNGVYPLPANCINIGCNLSNLTSYLVPDYVSTIPDDPGAPTKRILYVANTAADGYGLYTQHYETIPACKYVSPNGTTGWWGSAVPMC